MISFCHFHYFTNIYKKLTSENPHRGKIYLLEARLYVKSMKKMNIESWHIP